MNISTHLRGRAARRRLAAAVLTVGTLASVIAAQAGHADITPISDVGVSLLAAQATLSSTGQTVINYQSTATVKPGKDTLLRAQYYNDGTVPQFSATMTIDTGSKLDPAFTLSDPACVATLGATDVVKCSYRNVAPGQAEPFVYLAVTTATVTVTSTATQVSVVDSAVPVPQAAPDGDDSATATTNVGGSQFAFLADGESTSTTSADGLVSETFAVPAGGTGGGGVFVNLREDNTTATCGTTACYSKMAVADFSQVGGTNNPPAANNPFQVTVTYNGIKQNCAGLGGPSGCNPIYYQHSGSAAPPLATPLCSTYAPNNGTPNASSDPCVYKLSKTPAGVVTYFLAVLKDINLPISNPGGI
jgi:hypothetical protein